MLRLKDRTQATELHRFRPQIARRVVPDHRESAKILGKAVAVGGRLASSR